MFKLLWRFLKDERGTSLSITRPTSNTLITASGFASRYAEIEAVVNALTADNLGADCVTAVKLNADVVRSDYGLRQHTTGALYVDVSDTYPGLELSDGGLRVKVDDDTIERATGGIQCKSDKVMFLDTDQTIVGTKTFSTIPALPASDPTSDNQAVRKSYADNIGKQSAGGDLAGNYPNPTIANKASSMATNGYFNLGYGLIIQWGKASGGSDTEAISFPIAFSNACYSVTGTAAKGNVSSEQNIQVYSVTKNGFTMKHQSAERPAYWMAIGY